MFQAMNRHRKTTLALLSLSAALLISVIVWAVPGGNSGGWALSEDFECIDTPLYCVVWEFSPGEPSGPPCCVTASNLAFNVPTCTNFRTEPIDD